MGAAVTALITGAGGFAGHHLVKLLSQQTDWRLVEFVRRTDSAAPRQQRQRIPGDIRDGDLIRELLEDERPKYVFHLAAAIPPAPPSTVFSVNVAGTATLLNAIAETCPQATVLSVGSDAQYGWQDATRLPTPETAPMRPVGAYGLSKVFQEMIARRFSKVRRLSIICVRPFNHVGPIQSDRFVVARLARQIAEAEHGLRSSVVELRNREAMRDFTDVRDIVDGYLRLVLRGRPGTVYNLGSGIPRRIADVANVLSRLARIPITFCSTGDTRDGEVSITHCDNRRVRARTGWRPSIPIEQTLADTLDHWRTVVGTDALAP